MSADKIVIFLFAVAYALFILYSRKKTTFREYAVAGKSLGTFMIFSTLAATMIGPGYTLGTVSAGYDQGIFYYLMMAWVGVNFFVMGFFFTRPVYEKFPAAVSAGDVIAGPQAHNSETVRLVVGLLSFGQMFVIAVIMANAGGLLISYLFGWPQLPAVIVVTIIITAYSFFGGIKSTIITDAFQLGNFVVLIPVLLVSMLLSPSFSIDGYLHYSAGKLLVETADFDWSTYINISSNWLFLGMMHPMNVNRILASASAQIAQRSMFFNALFMFLWLGVMVVVGDLGGYLHGSLPVNDNILLELGRLHYPVIINGLFVVAMAGVIMSTQDSVLNNASVVFSADILSVLRQGMSEEKKLKYSKIAIVAMGLFSITAAQFIDSLLGAFILLTSVFIPSYLPVMIFSIFVKRPYWPAAVAAVVTGAASSLFWLSVEIDGKLPTVWVGLFFSTLAYFAFHIILKNRESSIK